jgi:NADPH:quinone reductase-like Zn-dependent oxidoreductase
MQAIVRERYGSPDVLQLKEVEKPVPNDVRGVLVKVHATSVNPADYYQMSAPVFMRALMRGGLRRPKDPRLGTDVAGRVEAVSSNVTQFKPGDEVFGVCPGSFAEYATAREDRLAKKPANCSFEEAAGVGIAGLTALQALRDQGQVQSGQKVVVNGAGGGVGTFAVQIAKSFGAEVTGVTNTANLDMVRQIGADHVIDYNKEDFTRNGEHYDLICDIAAKHSISDYKRALNPNGTCVVVGFRDKIITRLLYYAVRRRLSRGGKKFKFFIAKSNQKDITFLKELLETGKVKPVIDRGFTLGETSEAMRRLKEGNARGKIIITMEINNETESGVQSKKPLSIAA